MNNTLAFTYDTLDESSSMIVRQRTSEIKSLMRSTAQGIVEIGHKLIEVKEELPYGEFESWLRTEFDWSKKTAYNFINVAKHFSRVNFTQVDIATSALYMLSAPSTPDTARQEAVKRAEQGESISHSTAKEITDNHKDKDIPEGKPWTEEDYELYEQRKKELPDNVDPETGEVFDEDWEYDEETLEKQVPRNSDNEEPKSRGIGLQKAHEAIAKLKQIPPNDGLLQEGYDTVIQWIKTNR